MPETFYLFTQNVRKRQILQRCTPYALSTLATIIVSATIVASVDKPLVSTKVRLSQNASVSPRKIVGA